MNPAKRLLPAVWLAVALALPSGVSAQSVPDLLDFQGYLRTEGGQPVTKTVAMRVSLYDASSGGNLLYFEDLPMVPVYGGRFSVQVGATKLIPADLFDTHPSVFLGLIVDGSPELPRQQLLTVPYAFRSGTSGTADVAKVAKDLDCPGCVTTARLSDQSVTAAKIGEPCQEGQFLARVGGVWQCASLPTYSGKDFALSSQACEAGQKVQGIGNDGTLVCGDDAWQEYTAGTGLVLEAAKFSLDLSYADGRFVNAGEAGSVTGPMIVDGVVTASKLGEPCKEGEILKMLPSGWGCAPDSDTLYSGADFATSGQSCGAGQVVQGIGADGKVKCGPDGGNTYTAGPGLELAGDRFSLLPGCGDGQVPKWDATAKDWRCGDDNNMQVSAGIGLKLSGAILSADSATIQGWAKDVCYDAPGELAAALPGWDQDASDDLTVDTLFGGDVSGKYDALSIGAGRVTDAKIASVSWSKLTGMPPGFADGTDDGTTYTGGAGISITGTTISIPAGGVANGMLANSSLTVAAGTGLAGGGTVSLGGTTTLRVADTAVTPGTYKRATVTVDAQGRLTAAAAGADIDLTADITGVLPVANGGTGATTASGARSNLGAAASGVNADITGLTRLSTQAALTLLPYGTSTDAESEIRFLELLANGTNYVGFKAPDVIAANRIWTLPAADGATGQVLQTNGMGDLSWASVGTGSVTQVNSGAGLTGGPITSSGTLSIATGGVTNGMLANPSLSVIAGAGLSGGGTVSLGSATTLQIAQSGVTNGMLANASLTVAAGTGLTGGGTVALGGTTTLGLANTAVTAGTYKRATVTVDAQGRLTAAAAGPDIDLTADIVGILPVANGGTGSNSATGARVNLGAAASGVNADITGLTRLSTQAAVVILPYGTAADSEGEVRFQELAANGTNYVGFKAPDSIATNRIWTLPAAEGTAGQVLSTNGTGDLSWAPVGTGSVTLVNTGAGLTGGPITTTGTIAIANAGVSNAMLANSSVTVNAGSGLSGGGTVALGGSTTISVPTGGITTTHLADAVEFASVQNSAGTEQFTVTDGSNSLRFAASGSASIAFDAATHRITISATDANSGGTVTSIGPGTPGAATGSSGLTFSANPITSSGTLALSNTGVTAGTYTRATVTVDAQGRVTSAANGGTIDISADTSGTLPIARGGTGATTASGARTSLGVPAIDGTGATGTWGISISGNAATATTVSGTVGVDHGGTGLTSYTTGSLLYASAPTTLAGLADVATGSVLTSGGTGTAPAWGKVTTTHIQATGTPSATTFLRGDGTWASITSIVQQAASAPFTCNSTNAGASYYNTVDKQLYTCNGSRFVAIGANADALPGTTNDTALASCEAILAASPSAPNGIYYIDPAGGGTATAYPVYCWMNNVATIDGGGWALALNVDPNDGNIHPFRDVAFWGGGTAYGSIQAAMTADYKSQQVFGTDYQKLLVMVHRKGQMLGWREWYLPRSQSLYTQFSLPVMVQTTIAPNTNNGPWNSNTMTGNWGGSRGGPPLTALMINSSVGSLDSREAIVLPNGGLRLNMNWGNDGTPDGARVRSDTLDSAQGDNEKWGLGTQMDLNNWWNTWYYYPGCDVGTTWAWSNHFCVGNDMYNFAGGNAYGEASGLGYSYAFFVKGLPPQPNTALIGNSAATAAQSCEDLLARRPGTPSGVYYVDPTHAAGSPQAGSAYQVYCQMDVDGGGWTLAMNLDTGNGEFRGYKDSLWTANADIGTPALGLHGDYKSAKVFTSRNTKLMIMIHKNGTGPTATSTPPAGSTGFLGWRSWNLAGAGSLFEYFNRSPAARWPYSNLTDGVVGANVGAVSGIEAVVKPAGDLRVNAVWGDGTSWDTARIRTITYCSGSIGGYASSGACDDDNTEWGLGTQMDCNNNSGSSASISGYVPGGPTYMYCDAGSINPWSNGFCFGGDKWCPSCGDGYNSSTAWPDEQQLSYDYAVFVKGPVLNWDTSLVGNSSSNPGASCAAIKTARPSAPTGLYWLTGPIQVWCDMDLDGGGWVLAMNLNTSDGNVRYWMDSAFWTTTTAYGSATDPWLNDYKQSTVMGTNYSKILIRVHNGGLDTVGWRSWNLTSSRSLNNILTQPTSTTPTAVTVSITGSSTADLNAYEGLVLPSGNLIPNFKWGSNGDYGRLGNDGVSRADDKGGALGYVMNFDSNPTPSPAYYPACDASGTSWWSYYYCFGLDRTCAGNCGTGWGARVTTDNHYLQDYQYDYAIYMK